MKLDRRTFLGRVTLGASAAIAGIVGFPIVAYLFAPLFARATPAFVEVGRLADFKDGETQLVHFRDPSPLAWAGQTAETALWVRRRSEADFQVFNVNCTHLGCPVDWRASAKLFFCPCHGGVYNEDGSVAGGPPPRALFEREWRIEGDRLLVREAALPTPGGTK